MNEKRNLTFWMTVVATMAMLGVLGSAQSNQITQAKKDDTPLQRTNPVKMTDDSITRGEAVFTEYCVGCHGMRADGRGPQALNLIPRPQNLRNAPFVEYLDDERLFSSISGGVRGTSMPPYEMILSEEQRWDTVNYIRSLVTDFSLDIPNSPKIEKVESTLTNPVPETAESVAIGKKLFDKYCLSCHGEGADGKGKTAQNLVPRPRNLTVISSWGEVPFLNYLDDSRVYDSIANGVAGTSMSPWGNVLKPEEIWHMVNYLRAEAKKEKTDFEQSYKDN